ncbi:MAG: tRNA lysidine(34) synthetase TilS [Tannerellaceae bacterium]|nr:tRNA lysidine(34) synthetase TilS [Tannerellaceae bacterium]
MVDVVRTYICKHDLLLAGKPVIVGLSGGADSVALIALLCRLGYSCIAAHCNFHLRGDESDRDELFTESLAAQLGVPFYKRDFDTKSYAADKHLSIEMAARELRYEWFEWLRREVEAQAIAVAHHRDDNVETVLMNLIRGTGIRGIRGILPKNGYIVRPLLSVGREDILTWLREEDFSFVTDSSNLSDEYGRNFIRLNVLPLLERMNPSVKETIARSAEHFASVETIYQSVIERAQKDIITDRGSFSIRELLTYPSPETVLYELLIPFGFSRVVVKEIFMSLHKEPGRLFLSPSHRLIKDREFLLVAPIEKAPAGVYTLEGEEGEWLVPVKLSAHRVVLNKAFRFEKERGVAYFDCDKLCFPLTIRSWQPGDWFVPFGMRGRKKLSDYFSDCKYTLFDKEQTWLLCSGEDIIWIIGERSDHRFRITDTTREVLLVRLF